MKQRLFAISLILILSLSSILLLPQGQAQASRLAAVATATRTRTATKSATPSPTVSITPSVTSPALAPDLIISSISLVYQAGYTGSCRQFDSPVAIKATVKNIGNADAGAFTTSLSGVSIPGLAVGQTVDVTGYYGTYYPYYGSSGYTVTVDQYVNQVIESNENNNSLTVALPIAPLCTVTPTPTVDPLQPDLIIGVLGKALDPSITYVGGCYSASPFYDLSVEVKNIGGVAAGPFSVTVSNAGGSMSQSVSGLAAGQSTTVLFNFNSSRPLTVTVDSTNAVAESNENNSITYYVSSGTATNTGTQPPTPRVCTATPTPTGSTPTVTPTITPTIGTLPDLKINSMITTYAGEACMNHVYIAVVVSNIGTGDAGAFSVLFDATTQTVSGLAAGQQIMLAFPLGSVTGSFNTATADSTGVIAESDETNNVFTAYLALPPVAPTCTPTSFVTVTRTPTITPTPTVGGGCSPVNATITAPFTKDGAGTFCWQSTNLGTYINSWNLSSLTINGVAITNSYVPAASYPAKMGGYWYISYNSLVAWGHFEAK